MKALPSRFYGDPSDLVDEMRRLKEAGKREKTRSRVWKGLRIRALVKQVMMKGVKR